MIDKRTFAERFPLHEEMKYRQPDIQVINEFLEHVEADGEVDITEVQAERLVFGFFGVDKDAWDAEKEDMAEMTRRLSSLETLPE